MYLPAGAVLAALDDAPETVAKGRARVDQELHNAKVVGRFVVDLGWRQLKDQFESLAGGSRDLFGVAPDGGTGQRPPGRSGTGRSGSSQRDHHREPKREPAAPRPRPAPAPRDSEVDRAIPDYDILAASQVVRRLDGLGHEELRAVVRHERATRGRRTILHRAEQLLGTPAQDRPMGGPARPDGSAGQGPRPGASSNGDNSG